MTGLGKAFQPVENAVDPGHKIMGLQRVSGLLDLLEVGADGKEFFLAGDDRKRQPAASPSRAVRT